MTKEEAINILTYERDHDNFFSEYRNKVHDALSMAVEALSAERKGKWVEDDNVDLVSCSECHYGVMRWNANHYCPNCGADMKE